jgi:phage gpG-like protein
MSVGISIDDGGSLSRIDSRLRALSSLNVRDILEGVGAEVESQTRRRIQEEKRSPDGVDWPEWSSKYAGSQHGASSHEPHEGSLREAGGHSMLQLRGDLLDSIQYQLEGDDVLVGSNLAYAATQQFGRGNIPPREFLGLSNENRDDIERMLTSYLDGLL